MPTVLILGATSDMAEAIAREFAKAKYHVQLAARQTDKLQPLQSDIAIRYQTTSSVHHFDAGQFHTHQSFYNSLSPKPDVAICVFGYMKDNEKAIHDQVEMLQTINTNYTGAVSILNIIAADLMQKKQGTIAGISSVAGERGRQSNYIYGSAKAGFTAYLSGLRNRLFHENVHVVTVIPGFVYTKMTAHLNLPALLTAQPEDVGKAVYNAVVKKKNIIYVKWYWRWIMLIIRLIPEFMFKKKKL
ncbi:MAG: SDR family oxidoreductase [Chitinophagaceae bacterium]|nr:SDR family oxidoreductase [Chitinophagaceae bacterium]